MNRTTLKETGKAKKPTRAGPSKNDQLKKKPEMPGTSRKKDVKTTSDKTQKKRVEQTTRRKAPMTPHAAVAVYRKWLSVFERKEILGYPEIWYLGLKAQKIQGTCTQDRNFGYDDEKGYYVKVDKDHIAYRYEVLKALGQGSFSQVLKCRDHKTNEIVAVKVFRNKSWVHAESMNEVRILEALREKDKDHSHSVIHMKEYFHFRKHLCVTFELLESNLRDYMEKRHHQGCPKSTVHHIACSLLKCLQLLRNEKVIHCDLKPENIVISLEHLETKVIDFGISCYEDKRVLGCFGTRGYRAPEVLLRKWYGAGVDMWSLGCILAELHTGKPMFPGKDALDELACIVEVLGLPPFEFTWKCDIWSRHFDSNGMLRNHGIKRHPKTRPLCSVLHTTDPSFLDFVRRCLMWDPRSRMTPEEAMQHKWILKGCHENHQHQHKQEHISNTSHKHQEVMKAMKTKKMKTRKTLKGKTSGTNGCRQ